MSFPGELCLLFFVFGGGLYKSLDAARRELELTHLEQPQPAWRQRDLIVCLPFSMVLWEQGKASGGVPPMEIAIERQFQSIRYHKKEACTHDTMSKKGWEGEMVERQGKGRGGGFKEGKNVASAVRRAFLVVVHIQSKEA